MPLNRKNAGRIDGQGYPTGDMLPPEEILQGALDRTQTALRVAPADFQMVPNSAAAHAAATVGAAAQLLTATTGWVALHADTDYVLIDVELDSIRLTLNGTTPTSTLGFGYAAGFQGIILNRTEVEAAKVIRTGSVDARLQVAQFKAGN